MSVAVARHTSCLVAGLALAVSACAADPLVGVAPLSEMSTDSPTLKVSYTIEGPRLSTSPDVVYYLVLDTGGGAGDGPRINGAAPLSHPAPDPRAFLPFVRTEADILDREPVVVEDSRWTDYFALVQDGGTWTMWHGRREANGTITDRLRGLTPGAEWGVLEGRTVQLRLPLSYLQLPSQIPAQFEANLAVSRQAGGRGHVIDGWRPLPPADADPNRRPEVGPRAGAWLPANYSQIYFAIPTTGETRTETDTSPLAVPGNAIGPANSLNIVSYTAGVTGLVSPAPASPAP